MRILTRADVRRLIDMESCINVNEEAYIAVATGRAQVPVRHQIGVEGQGEAVALFMPGYLPDAGALGMKVVSVFPGNVGAGLPATLGAVLLVSPETGAPVALMDGTWLTSLRTGAGTGVATRLLAGAESRVLTLLGAGGMGFHQVEAVLAVRPVEKIYIWNRTHQRAVALAEQVMAHCATLGRPVTVAAVTDRDAAVQVADVIVASTAAAEPVVLGHLVKPGAHVNLVGAHGSAMREGDDELLRRASLRAVDALDSAEASGELRLPLAAGVLARSAFVAVGAIAAGLAPGRRSADEVTWFKSVGLAAQDMACAALVYRRALAENLGTEVEL